MEIRMIDYSRNGSMNILRSMRRCHGKAPDVDRVSSEDGKKIALYAVDRKHYALLEHVWFSFEVLDISRKCMDQFTRHRHLSFCVESTSRAFPQGMAFPKTYAPNVQNRFLAVFYRNSIDYHWLLEHGVSREDASRVLPLGSFSSCQVSGNGRSWYEFIQKRLCRHANWEIRDMAKQFKEYLSGLIPTVFGSVGCSRCSENCPVDIEIKK